MLKAFGTRWSKISAGVLLGALLGLGGAKAYEHFAGDCCRPGASCCFPGSPCCEARRIAQK
jgi:hypothetical protein